MEVREEGMEVQEETVWKRSFGGRLQVPSQGSVALHV